MCKHLELLNTVGNIRFVAQTLNSLYTAKLDDIETFIVKLKEEILHQRAVLGDLDTNDKRIKKIINTYWNN